MTHPHGLTRADVAHLKAGDEVTFIREMATDNSAPITSVAYADSADGSLWCAGYLIRRKDGDPAIFLVEVVSPKPPVPPMAEPTWIGAVVMCDGSDGLTLMMRFRHKDAAPDVWINGFSDTYQWSELPDPRPLTDAERRNRGIPETIPEGWVCVDVSSITDDALIVLAAENNGTHLVRNRILADVARAERARREATA